MLGKLRGVIPLALATLTTLGGAFAANDAYVVPSLVRLRQEGPLQPLIDRVFDAGWDVVARGKGWIDVLAPQEQALAGFTGLGLEEAGIQVEIRRANADDEFAAFRGREDAGAYHTYAEVRSEIDALVAAKPDVIRQEVIGTTVEGRDIVGVQISAGGDPADKPAMLVTGLHHSREWISVEVPMALIHQLVEGYGQVDWITEVVNGRNLWVIPVVNPDGHFYSQTQYKMWRKNRATNEDGSRGVDPNRNYGYNWGMPGASPSPSSETYRGPSAFSEPEIQAVRDLGIREGFVSAISFHSYSELVLWPWGYTYDPAPDEDVLAYHGRKMGALTGYTPQQSSDLYPTSGDFDDWFYGDQGALAYTFELGKQFVPPEDQIPGIVNPNLAALKYFLVNCADPFPLVTHQTREATTDISGPYGLSLRLSKRYQAADPIAKAEVVYRLPGAEQPARLPLIKGEDGRYTVDVPGAGAYGTVEYHFVVTEKGPDDETPGPSHRLPEEGEYSFDVVETLYLVIDDDKTGNHELAYQAALEELGLAYQVRASESLQAADLLGASAVIWFTGSDSSTTLTGDEQALLSEYLQAGGELALFGQDIGYDIKNEAFYAEVLKSEFVKDKAGGNAFVGAAGSFLDGVSGAFGTGDGASQRYPEVVAAKPGAQPLFTYEDSSEVGGVAFAGAYRLAYFGIGLESIDTAAARADVLGRTLAFLEADGAARKARRSRLLRSLPGGEGAVHRLDAQVVDAARRLGEAGDRTALEELIEVADPGMRQPLLRAFLQAVAGAR